MIQVFEVVYMQGLGGVKALTDREGNSRLLALVEEI